MNLDRFLQSLHKERTAVAAVSTTVADNIASLSEILGMLSLPGIPAALTGISSFFVLVEANWPLWAALTISVIVGFGLEALGIVATKTSLRMYRAWRDGLNTPAEFLASALIPILYVILVTGVLLFGGGLPEKVRVAGYASPWLAVGFYIVAGLHADLRERMDIEAQARLAEQDFENEKRLLRLADEREKLVIRRRQQMLRFEQRLEIRRKKLEKEIL